MGITGTEVTKEAAVMILTDDNFSTIIKAVEVGRGLYDNLARYVRFQIGGLFGYIFTFLGASIFNVAKGIPLLPLQTLWVSFTMLSIQSVGLGYSKPAAGLMDRPPLPPTKPILTRGLIVWLAFVGLVMTVGTLSVISWAEQVHGLAVARTMGMVTFALFLLFFSIESKDQRDSAFSLDTFSDKTFVVTTSGSFVLLILSTVLDIFHTVMKTVTLDVRQWLISAAVALSIVLVAEIRKAVLRRTAATAIHPASALPVLRHLGQRLAAGAEVTGPDPVGQPGAGRATGPDRVEVMSGPHAGDSRGAEVLGQEPLGRGQMGGVAHDLADCVHVFPRRDLSSGQRAGLHAAAAGCLAHKGASAHLIAAHLLATDPAGDDRVVDSLVSAARAAIANGAPDPAVAYLRRALSEPPSERLLPDVLLELGFAESFAGDPQAAAHLEAALDVAPGSHPDCPRGLHPVSTRSPHLGRFDAPSWSAGLIDRSPSSRFFSPLP
jgi:hypothetical protein